MSATENRLIGTYEAVAEFTRLMLVAVRQGDYDRLAVLEEECTRCVGQLRGIDQVAPLTDEQRARKIAMIRQILANDRELRDITEPWMTRLASMMRSPDAEARQSSTVVRSNEGAR